MRYLQSFGDVTHRRLVPLSSHGRSRNTYSGLASLISSRSLTSHSRVYPSHSNCYPADLQAELDKVGTWDCFDVFKVHELSGGRPLTVVCTALLQRLGLIERLALSEESLSHFLHAVEASYNADNCYHNALHAADVAQTVGSFLLADAEHLSQLTDLEVLAMLLAAVIHDVGHPGLTNDFLIKSGAFGIAKRYNNQSVNERWHLERGLALLFDPAAAAATCTAPCNCGGQGQGPPDLCEEATTTEDIAAAEAAVGTSTSAHECAPLLAHLPAADQAYMREALTAVVLATDMSHHKHLIDSFQVLLSRLGPDLGAWDGAARLKLLEVLVHCADISNPLKPADSSIAWAERVLNELWLQGDEEARQGLALSALCDRDATNIPKCQLGFLEFVVKPSYDMLSPLLPVTCTLALETYGVAAREHWESIIAEGRNTFR